VWGGLSLLRATLVLFILPVSIRAFCSASAAASGITPLRHANLHAWFALSVGAHIVKKITVPLLLAARVTLQRIPPFHLLLRVSRALTLTLGLIVGISLILLIPLAVNFGSIVLTWAGFALGILDSVP